MNWSINLMRVKGIKIKVHLTFALILVWAAYAWGFSTGQGLSGAAFGIVATLLLFVGITLHELGHSVQAMREGYRVREILLLPIGGVAQIDLPPGKPAPELRIALAGPIVSLALAVFFYGVLLVINATAGGGPIELALLPTALTATALVGYLALANLMLGLFNLLPAFPMDGGRIFRALLALRLPYERATSVAASFGQGFAWIFALAGVLSGNIFLILVGVFIWMGAGSEAALAQARSTLQDLRVRTAMSRQPLVLNPSDRLAKAVELTLSTFQSDFPVVASESERVIGLLTSSDLLHGLRDRGLQGSIGGAMRSSYVAARPDDSLHDTQLRLLAGSGRCAVVLDDTGRLVGLLTTADVNEALLMLAASGTPARQAA